MTLMRCLCPLSFVVITKLPYEVTETGWGEFEVVIKIHFHDPNERPVSKKGGTNFKIYRIIFQMLLFNAGAEGFHCWLLLSCGYFLFRVNPMLNISATDSMSHATV